MAMAEVKALTFDVFGTVVDWRSTIIREGMALGEAKGLDVDWAAFADAWRGGYRPAMERVRRGEVPWAKIDDLHRTILDGLLSLFGVEGLSEDEIAELNRVWHRLDPWPDAIGGLLRLRARYVVAALSNGNVSLLTHMAKHAGLPWDCILSAELAQGYKPDPEVYITAADLLSLPPAQVMMVAAHEGDLLAAKGVGMRTAYVPRPVEYGPDSTPPTVDESAFDLVAQDIHALAEELGA